MFIDILLNIKMILYLPQKKTDLDVHLSFPESEINYLLYSSSMKYL